MKKRFLFFCLALFLTRAFSQEMEFIVKEDIELQDNSDNEITSFKKGNLLYANPDFIGIETEKLDNFEIWTLINKKTGFDYTFSVDYVIPTNNTNILPLTLKKSYWIPKYYYDQLLKNDRNQLMFQNEKFWNEWKITADEIETWKDDFYIQRFVLGDYFIKIIIDTVAWRDVNFICYLDEITNKQFIYSVQIMSSGYKQYNKYLDKSTHPEFKFLFKKDKPFKIIFTIDGDFLKMYIDEISEKTLFKTLAKATPEACKQIEEWIAEKSDNLSAVVWPHHADGTSEYEDTIRYPGEEVNNNSSNDSESNDEEFSQEFLDWLSGKEYETQEQSEDDSKEKNEEIYKINKIQILFFFIIIIIFSIIIIIKKRIRKNGNK